jgi:4-amino-4-deoxy-L-arabinose transferase-like glycosyltransferase
VAVLAAYALLAVRYALLTPLWQNPDEPAHVAYVQDVARTGRLPVLEPGDWDAALLERLKNGQLQPGDSVASIRYESWQPPLYYLLAAPVARLSGDRDVYALRLFDVALGVLTLLLAYAAGRRVFDKDAYWVALAVPVTMIGVPMFTAISAAVSDDALANLLAALLTLLLLRLVSLDAVGWHEAVVLGVALGLGVLTKLLLALFAPIALVVLLLAARRARLGRSEAARLAVGLAVVAFVVVLPWLVRQGLTYGWTDLLATRRHDAVVGDQPRFPGLTPGYAAGWAATVFHSFWAQFGWMAIPMPDRLYWAWGALCLLALLGLAWWLRSRRPRAAPGIVALLALIALTAFAVLVGYNTVFIQAQGRYLFPALVPMAILLVLGWRALHIPALALPIVLVALNAYVLTHILPPAFGLS